MLGAVFNSNNSTRWFAKEMPPRILLPGHSSLLLPTRRAQPQLPPPSQPSSLPRPDGMEGLTRGLNETPWGYWNPGEGFGWREGREFGVGMSSLYLLTCGKRRTVLAEKLPQWHRPTPVQSYTSAPGDCHLLCTWKSYGKIKMVLQTSKSLKKVLGWRSGLCTGSEPWPLSLFSHRVLSCCWKPTTQLRGSERLLILELNMNIQGPGTQIRVATNTMFQPSNNFAEFYCNRTKQKPRQF